MFKISLPRKYMEFSVGDWVWMDFAPPDHNGIIMTGVVLKIYDDDRNCDVAVKNPGGTWSRIFHRKSNLSWTGAKYFGPDIVPVENTTPMPPRTGLKYGENDLN